MSNHPDDRRLLEEIREAIYEASGPSWDETLPLAERILELVGLDKERRGKGGTWPECPQRAFVEGARWLFFDRMGTTLFPSERDAIEQEAVKRYGDPPTDRPGPRCATCGRVRDDHPDHPFAMPKPEGCCCDPGRLWTSEPKPICSRYQPRAYQCGDILFVQCGNCEHDEGCHRPCRREYAKPAIERGFRNAPELSDRNFKRALLENGVPDIHATEAARRLAAAKGSNDE